MPRPKEFDPEQALDKAMHLFWRKGYEATSVQDLVDAMGINRFSLYDTFGDKHRLFLATLDRYSQKVVFDRLCALEQSEEGLGAIRRYFQGVLKSTQSKEGLKGCLLTNCAIEVAPYDEEAAARIRTHLKRMEDIFYKALLRARTRGELRENLSLRDTARFLTNSAQGLGVLTKARPGRKEVGGIIRIILSTLQNS